jgi:hypothetical protein
VIHRPYPLGQRDMFLQQPQRPPRTPHRRLTTRQRDHPRLDITGHLRLHRRRLALLTPDHVTNALATRYTVPSDIPSRSATTRRSGTGPYDSSNANNTLARFITHAR